MAESDPDFKVWRASLKEAQVTHVLSLLPPSIEVDWMHEHSDQFTQLAGNGAKWDLFRIEMNDVERPVEK